MKYLTRHRLIGPICGLVVGATVSTLGALSTPVGAATSPSKNVLAYGTRGSNAVGYRVFETVGASQKLLTVRAWYPTRQTTDDSTITYTANSKFGDNVLAAKQITSVGRAIANAKPVKAKQAYPLVVFTHGFAISPIVFSSIVEHYASRGYIVLAPEHNETFDETLVQFVPALIDRPIDIRKTIDLAEQLNKSGSTFAGLIDLQKVSVVGHSYGGYTALAVAGARYDFAAYKTRCAALKAEDPLQFFCAPVIPREAEMAKMAGLSSIPTGLWPSVKDTRVKSIVTMAGDAYMFDKRGLAEITIPVMSLGGTVDEGTPYEWGAKLTFDHVASKNNSLVIFPGAGHNLPVDSCDKLPWTENFSYRDGFCKDAVFGTTRPTEVVAHYTTAFLRETLNADSRAKDALRGKQPTIANVEYTRPVTR
jgi:predicted dienelactone hydrolase